MRFFACGACFASALLRVCDFFVAIDMEFAVTKGKVSLRSG